MLKTDKYTTTKNTAAKAFSVTLCAALALNYTGCGSKPESGAPQAIDTFSENIPPAAPNTQANLSHSSSSGKEETVYVLADASGNVNEIIVSDWLKNGSGDGTLADRTDLKNIENVKGYETFQAGQNGNLIWQADGTDIYYQGHSDKEMPVAVKLSYQLDGKDISPQELAGKSGRVTIRLDYENRETKTVMIGDKEVEVKIPFAMVSGLILPQDTFSNIEVTNARLLSDGSNSVVVGVAFPGLRESMNIDELKDRLSDEEELKELEIPDYIEITADVEDFSLGMTMTVAMSDIFSQLDMAASFDLSELTDSMDELKDATQDLKDGVVELKDGSGQLRDGTEELLSGAGELDDGAADLLNGTIRLDDGAGDLLAGVSQLDTGAGSLLSGAARLDDGASTLVAGTVRLDNGAVDLASGAGQLQEGISSLASGAVQLDGGATALATGAVSLRDGTQELYMGTDGLYNGASVLYNGALALQQGILDLSQGAIALQAGANELNVGTGNLRNGLESLYNGALLLKGGLGQVAEQMNLLRAGIGTPVTDPNTLDPSNPQTLLQVSYLLDQYLKDLSAADGLSDAAYLRILASLQQQKADAEKQLEEAQNSLVTAQNRSSQAREELAAACQISTQNIEVVTGTHLETESLDIASMPASVSGSDAGDGQTLDVTREIVDTNTLQVSSVDVNALEEKLDAYQTAIMDEAACTAQVNACLIQIAALDQQLTMAEQDLAADQAALTQKWGPAITYSAVMNQKLCEIAGTINSQESMTGMATLVAGSESLAAGTQNALQGATALQTGAGQLATGLDTLGAGVGELAAGAEGFVGGTAQVRDGAQKLSAGAENLHTGAGTLADGAGTFKNGISNLRAGAETLQAGIGQLQEGISTLRNGTGELRSGAGTLKDGTGELRSGAGTLKNGTGELHLGAGTVKDGTAQLKAGAESLKSGTGELREGASTLADGMAELDDGAQELVDGMFRFDEEGISKLTELFGSDVQEVVDRLEAISDAGRDYDTFTGLPEGMDGTVKFIIKTDAIEQ